MSEQVTRRETLRRGLAATSLLALVSDWATPSLAQGDTEVPFTDIPATFNPNNPNATTRILDIRKIDGPLTPKEQFVAVQHFNRPEIDPATYRLKFTGWSTRRLNSLWRSCVRCARPSWRRATNVPGIAGGPCRAYLLVAALAVCD